MPLEYDDEPGSWGRMSEGWPTTPNSIGKMLLCNKTDIVPYGSYVIVGDVIRVENEALRDKLEKVYHEIFELCGDLLCDDPAILKVVKKAFDERNRYSIRETTKLENLINSMSDDIIRKQETLP